MFPCVSIRYERTNDRCRPVDHDAACFRRDVFRSGLRVPCFWCGKRLQRAHATVEHVVPRSRGGKSTAENLEIACYDCNTTRGLLSRLAGRIRLVMQNKHRNSLHLRKAQLRRLLCERERLLPMLLELERLYYEKLTDWRLRACLRELDEVLKVEMF